MQKSFIMTAFGKDRPGIAAQVSQLIYENGCNLEDSRMTRLADEFAIILLLSGNGDDLEDQLSKGCRRLEKEKGISAFLRPVRSKDVEARKPFSSHILHIEGADQAGIVYKISKYLSDNHVNISNLESRMKYSPESGMPIYTMKMEIEIPDDASLNEIENGLIRIGDELNLEIGGMGNR